MKYCQDFWQKYGINEESEKLFYSFLKELMFQKTFVSWQYKYSNMKTILDEIISYCSLLEKSNKGYGYLHDLITEAKSIYNRDYIGKLYLNIFDKLTSLETSSNELLQEKNAQDKIIKRISSDALLLKGLLYDYQDRVQRKLESLISENKVKEKRYFLSLCRQYVTSVVADGYSPRTVQESIAFENNDKSFRDRLGQFFNFFNFNEQNFNAYYLIETALPVINNHEITITKDIDPENTNLVEFCKQSHGAYVLCVTTKSISFNEAKQKADEVKNSYLGVRQFYSPLSNAKEFDKVYISNSENQFHVLNQHESWQDYLFNSKKLDVNIDNFMQLQSNLSNSDFRKLSTSLQYHNIALENHNDTTRLVNMWISAESLIEKNNGTIIDAICRYISSSNTTRYVFNLCEALSHRLKFYLNEPKRPTIKARELLQYFFIDDSEIKDKLFSKFPDDPLLINRITEIKENTFASREKLKERLEQHTQSIDWQIRRIYKVRNSIMHDGVSSKRVRQLTFHLHKYYIQTMHNLIYDLRCCPDWSIQTALIHRKSLLDDFIKILGSKENINIDSLLDIHKIYDENRGDVIWK